MRWDSSETDYNDEALRRPENRARARLVEGDLNNSALSSMKPFVPGILATANRPTTRDGTARQSVIEVPFRGTRQPADTRAHAGSHR